MAIKYPKLRYDDPWPGTDDCNRLLHPAWLRVDRMERDVRRLKWAHASQDVPGAMSLFRAGYWTRDQVAAVDDDWLLATVKFLGVAGVRALRRVIPHVN